MIDSWKNIDQIFQDKLNKFEADPPAHIWDNIKNTISDHPDIPPPDKGNGRISSLLIFIAVFLFVSFISPKTNVTTEIDNAALQSEEDLYYNSVSIENKAINETQIKKEKPSPAAISVTEESNNLVSYNTVKSEQKIENISNSVTENQKELPKAFSGERDFEKIKQIHTSLIKSGIDENEIEQILNLYAIPEFNGDKNSKTRTKGNWLIGVSFTPETVFFNTTDNINNQRYSGGIDVIYKKNPFVFQSGIHLLKTKDCGELKIDYEKYVGSYDDVYDITFDTINGVAIPTFHTEVVNVYDSIKHVNYSPLETNYYYIHIPLLAGYEVEQRRITWTLMAGPTLSFKISENNNYVTPDALADDKILDQEYQTQKRLNTNMQVMLLTGMRYKLSRHMSFSFQPMMRYNITSIYEKNAVSTKHPYSLGIRTGIVIDF